MRMRTRWRRWRDAHPGAYGLFFVVGWAILGFLMLHGVIWIANVLFPYV